MENSHSQSQCGTLWIPGDTGAQTLCSLKGRSPDLLQRLLPGSLKPSMLWSSAFHDFLVTAVGYSWLQLCELSAPSLRPLHSLPTSWHLFLQVVCEGILSFPEAVHLIISFWMTLSTDLEHLNGRDSFGAEHLPRTCEALVQSPPPPQK